MLPRALLSTLLLLTLCAAPAEAQFKRRPRLDLSAQERAKEVFELLGPEHVLREAWRTTRKTFYDRSVLRAKDWDGILTRYLPLASATKSSAQVHAVVNRMLGELKTSHLVLLEYGVWSRELAQEFRNRPAPRAGCELVKLGKKYFVADVAEGGPAAKAGLLEGDEVLTLAGEAPSASDLLVPGGHDAGLPGPEGFSIRVTPGKTIAFQIRRTRAGAPQAKLLDPTPFSLIQAAKNSVRIETVAGVKVGVIHLPHFIHTEIYRLTRKALLGKLKDAETLVLDVRGRGGSSAVVRGILNLFSGWRKVWDKPVVVLTDKTTRSAKEIFAFHWKRQNLGPIVGERTQGACIGCTFRQLSDGSVLCVPIMDVRRLSRGVVLEGVGVAPTVKVPDAPLPYRAGKDPILTAGLQRAAALGKRSRSEAF